MNGFELYCRYVAMKCYFSDQGYDYFKYGGVIKARHETFVKRRDRYFFEKLAKHKDPVNYLLANFVDDTKFWIGEIREMTTEKTYIEWRKRQDTLTYTYEQDLLKLDEDFDSNLICEKFGHPKLLKLYLRKEVCIETLIILDMLTNYTRHWNVVLGDDFVCKEVMDKMLKYRAFLSINLDKFREVSLNTCRAS
tara:strand:- start:7265 stop:7843 length:579 start_codon:yes stop_codon:yes gene_type:complete